MNYKWFVGIDIAKKTLDVVLYKKEFQKKSPYCQIPNNCDGFTLMDPDSVGLCFVLQTHPSKLRPNAIPVRQIGILPAASFRSHLAVGTLALS